MDGGPGRGWQQLHEIFDRHQRFLLTSHVFPEGDSLGSEVGLAHHLRNLGKSVVVMNPTPARDCYRFLFDLFPIHHLGENGTPPVPPGTEAIIVLDVGQWDYVGAFAGPIRSSGLPVVVIDHHHGQPDFGTAAFIDPDASSTGELIYQYLRWSEARITPPMAQSLYASILFDTWGLRLPQTTNQTVLLASELLRHGADHRQVTRAIFESESYERLDLYRRALERLRHELEGRLVWISIPDRVFRETGTSLHDGDGILDNLLAVQPVQLAALLREVPGHGVRVTFRSKGRHDVGMIAAGLGGGGRPTASGAFLLMSLPEAENLVLPMLRDLEAETVPALTQRTMLS
jgi:phosphoesterase RecJ-like protein